MKFDVLKVLTLRNALSNYQLGKHEVMTTTTRMVMMMIFNEGTQPATEIFSRALKKNQINLLTNLKTA